MKYLLENKEVEGVLSLTDNGSYIITGKDEDGNEAVSVTKNIPRPKLGEEYKDKKYKVYFLLSEFMLSQGIAPCTINFKKDMQEKLFEYKPFEYFENGRLVKIEYFLIDSETGLPSDELAILVTIKYEEIKNNRKYSLKRTKTIQWVDLDGELGETKGWDMTTKTNFYTPDMVTDEGESRRKNVIKNMRAKVKNMNASTKNPLNTLFNDFDADISLFERTGSDKFAKKLKTHKKGWMDKKHQGKSIRDHIINDLMG